MKSTPAHDPESVLDDALVAQISAAITPEPLDEVTQARIKRRLLRRIAAASTDQHLTLAEPQAGWKPFSPGIDIRVLHQDGGILSYLLRLAAGAALPPHRHPVDEECVVLQGEVCIGELRLGAGGFHLGRKDVLHDRLHSPDGAVIYLRGAVPDAALSI
jgi:anti-sigma factor ChrR (cupin superfamily)